MVGRSGECMGLLGRRVTGVLAAVLLAGGPALCVQAEGNFSLHFEKPEGEKCYALLPVQDAFYEVEKGDSLWRIADRLWEDGRLYSVLYDLNKEGVKNPDLIYPGQRLKITRPLYLERQGGAIEYTDVYAYSEPNDCTVGLLSTEGVGATCVLYGHDEKSYDIACMIREKEAAQDSLKDSAAWEKTIRAYVEDQCGDLVQDLMFEQYLSEDGDPVYLYSYVYEIDLSQYEREGRIHLYVSAGVKQTAHMQADFVGFGTDGDSLRDRVRYVTASFEELLPQGVACTVNDNNIILYPSTEWEAASFNVFAWIEQYFDASLRASTGYNEKQKSNKERLLDQMREGKGTYGGKKKAE